MSYGNTKFLGAFATQYFCAKSLTSVTKVLNFKSYTSVKNRLLLIYSYIYYLCLIHYIHYYLCIAYYYINFSSHFINKSIIR